MGIAKRAWMEAQDRGWSDIDKRVCSDCVEDEHLKELIDQAADAVECDYCGEVSENDIAAPVEEIMPAVMGALTHYFAEPARAGVPYESAEGGYLIQGADTADALMSLPFECDDDLFQDIVSSISSQNASWVEAAGGHWASEQKNRQLTHGWHRFAEHVKHRQRYFFAESGEDNGPDIEPSRLLPELGNAVRDLDLFCELGTDENLFRARLRASEDSWDFDAENLGAPPPRKAAAGRMNPAGIPYLYVAMEEETAIAEVGPAPPCTVAVATFRSSRALKVLNLNNLPATPSMFDHERLRERELWIFLGSFVEAISQPVAKDGAEHIDYVPSQVVCEYFASAHDGESLLDGIFYPSAIRKGGRNLVLFPNHDDSNNLFSHVVFVDVKRLDVDT